MIGNFPALVLIELEKIKMNQQRQLYENLFAKVTKVS